MIEHVAGGLRPGAAAVRVRVWDVPTRTFHWLFALAFLGEWLTRDARYTAIHVLLGYAMAALLAFRVVWGFVGTRWARFASFTYSPAKSVRYLVALGRGRPPHFTGHNPAGSVAIYALLLLATIVIVTGLLTLGGEDHHGPLRDSVGYASADAAHRVHEFAAWTMLTLVTLHIAGVLAGTVADRENLVRAMITGSKRTHASPVPARRGIAWLMLIALVAGTAWYVREYFTISDPTGYRPFPVAALPSDPTWTSECSDCHLAYHPSLLPARSWQALFAHQADHFGEDLSLSEDVVAKLQSFAAAHSAEHRESAAAWHIDTGTPAGAAPLRITETQYWRSRHLRLKAEELARVHAFDCSGCHLDAADGTFQPGAIRIGAAPPPSSRRK